MAWSGSGRPAHVGAAAGEAAGRVEDDRRRPASGRCAGVALRAARSGTRRRCASGRGAAVGRRRVAGGLRRHLLGGGRPAGGLLAWCASAWRAASAPSASRRRSAFGAPRSARVGLGGGLLRARRLRRSAFVASAAGRRLGGSRLLRRGLFVRFGLAAASVAAALGFGVAGAASAPRLGILDSGPASPRPALGGVRRGRLGASAHRHVAADVDPPAGQAGGEPGVLALAADGQREHPLGHGHARDAVLLVDVDAR